MVFRYANKGRLIQFKIRTQFKGYFEEIEKPHPVSEEMTVFSAKHILNFRNYLINYSYLSQMAQIIKLRYVIRNFITNRR